MMRSATGQALDRIIGYSNRITSGEFPLDSMLNRIMRFFVRVCEGAWMIRDEHEQIVPMKPRPAQIELTAAMMDQAALNLPIRILIGKDRKRGMSTWVQCLFCDLCSHENNQRAVTIAHESTATTEIFTIARTAADYGIVPCIPNKMDITWPATKSNYHAQTAGATAVGAGGTPNLLHLSELAKWDQNKEDTHTNSVNAVPTTGTSIIVKESTFELRELFWNQFEAACDEANPYIPLFFPWFANPKPSIPAKIGFIMSDDERGIVNHAKGQGVELSYDNLQWRRNKIAEIGRHRFRREYPVSPQEAVQASEGLIFPYMRDLVIDELPFDPTGLDIYSQLRGGIDYGFNDPTVILSGWFIDDALFITRCWRQREGQPATHTKGLLKGAKYYDDPSGLKARAELRAASEREALCCKFIAAPRRKEGEKDFVNEEIRLVEKWMLGGKIQILRSAATQLIVESDSYAWNPNTSKPDDTRGESWGHFDTLDALRYAIMGLQSERSVLKPIEKRSTPSIRSQLRAM